MATRKADHNSSSYAGHGWPLCRAAPNEPHKRPATESQKIPIMQVGHAGNECKNGKQLRSYKRWQPALDVIRDTHFCKGRWVPANA